MKKITIFIISMMMAMMFMTASGCRDTFSRAEKFFNIEDLEDSFYVFIAFPTLQKEFTEGYPKEIKALAYLGDKELKNRVTYI